MNEKEKLIQKLESEYGQQFPMYIDRVADMLIADRLRVVEPLVKWYETESDYAWLKAIDQ